MFFSLSHRLNIQQHNHSSTTLPQSPLTTKPSIHITTVITNINHHHPSLFCLSLYTNLTTAIAHCSHQSPPPCSNPPSNCNIIFSDSFLTTIVERERVKENSSEEVPLPPPPSFSLLLSCLRGFRSMFFLGLIFAIS